MSDDHAGACAHCGHAPRPPRLTLSRLVHIAGAHLSLERGLLLTLRDLLVRPGRVIQGFIDGERGRYVSPITAFFFAAAVSLIVLHVFEHGLLDYTRHDMARRLATLPRAQLDRAYAFLDAMMRVSSKPALVGFVSCFPQAVAMRLLFPRAGWNHAEALVYALYMRALTFVVYSVLFVPWMGLTGAWNHSTWTTMAVTGAISLQAACDLFGWRWGVAWRGLLAAGIGWVAGILFSIAAAVVLMLSHAG